MAPEDHLLTESRNPASETIDALSAAEIVALMNAEDAQVVMSHRHDQLRVFNPGTTQPHYAVSQDGRSGVLHAVVHEAPNARTPMSVWFRRAWAGARAWSLDRAEPLPLERASADAGVLFEPPPTPIYFALELSG